jgi:hypothetical protein
VGLLVDTYINPKPQTLHTHANVYRYVGVVVDVARDAAGNVVRARTLFEDGEDTWVEWPDPSGTSALMPQALSLLALLVQNYKY